MEDKRYKGLERGVSYYALGLDTARLTTQKVALTLLGGVFYGNEYFKLGRKSIDNGTVGIYLGVGAKLDITDNLSIKGDASLYSGLDETFDRKVITSYGIGYKF